MKDLKRLSIRITSSPTLQRHAAMNMQLLLCESNESSLGELRDYLTGRGFDVEVASNGLQCLLLLREMRPDIVVLNWELPWGGGDGVLSVLQEEFRLLPVVISTRNLSTVSRTLRYDGIVELIGRPLRPKEVYSGILNALRRSENLCETIPDTQPVGATGKL